MKPKSNTLFHFTKSRETLKLILKNGFWPKYCLENMGWLGFADYDYIAFPMVCFCDIPLSRISDHVGFYGEFGLGLTREWAETNGLNPVLYIAGSNHVSRSFKEYPTHAAELQETEKRNALLSTTRYLLAYTKPTAGTTVVDGTPVGKLFYQESEWRYVPKHSEIEEFLLRSGFNSVEELSAANGLTKQHCTIKCGPRDIRYIFVKSDSDIPDLINFIQVELEQYPGVDLKILMSRVVSLESLREDV